MSSKNPSGFTFSDLFAGVGGFHAALHAAGGHWAFASEIDKDAAAVYDYNWLRPLREADSPLPDGVREFTVSGDIVPLTDPAVLVPRTDVLAAGFPCQPFSKSGFQRGMAETRGTLFWNIARILQDEATRPSVVLLENVRNLAGPKHRDTTFKTIVTTLRELGYRTSSKPAIFSPHLLPPELGGRPQVRERVFILAHLAPRTATTEVNDEPIVTPKTQNLQWDKYQWNLEKHLPLEQDGKVGREFDLKPSEAEWIRVWGRMLSEIAESPEFTGRLPGHPIWFDEFRSEEDAIDLVEAAEMDGEELPPWKADFLIKNGQFYDKYAQIIERYRDEIADFPPSRRKFEWQAGEPKPLSETILHLRPSGIRCKRPDYVPALVAINQTSILARPGRDGSRSAPKMRRLTPRETARLQGFPETFEFKRRDPSSDVIVDQRHPSSYKQMGNGVNVGAAFYVFSQYVLEHADEIPAHIVEAVRASSNDGLRGPDEALGTARTF